MLAFSLRNATSNAKTTQKRSVFWKMSSFFNMKARSLLPIHLSHFNPAMLGTIAHKKVTILNWLILNIYHTEYLRLWCDIICKTSLYQLDSSISLLKGNAHEALNNIPLAVFWYREAFRRDAFCYEAIDKLTKLEAFTSEDEKILSHYEYSDLSTDFISAMKTIIIGKVRSVRRTYPIISQNSPAEFPPHLSCLKNNIDVLVTEAENLLSINHYRKCFALTSK